MIYLTEQDALELLTIHDALTAVDQALSSVAKGTAAVAPRSRASLNGLNLNLLGGSIAGSGTGAKIYVTGGGAAKFWILLFDENGTLLALCEADRIGQLRTGAASGVSSRVLARPDSRRLAMIGTGYQARTQVEAIVAATGITEVAVYGRNTPKAETFATALTADLGVKARVGASVEDTVDKADIVVTATSATDPLVHPQHVRAGTHYIFAGSNNPGNAEAAPPVLAAMDLLVTDDIEQAKRESGTLLRAATQGTINWADVGTLGDSLLGTGLVRTDPHQMTAFVSHGLGTWDTALAQILYTKAQGAGRGVTLPVDGAPTQGRR